MLPALALGGFGIGYVSPTCVGLLLCDPGIASAVTALALQRRRLPEPVLTPA